MLCHIGTLKTSSDSLKQLLKSKAGLPKAAARGDFNLQ